MLDFLKQVTIDATKSAKQPKVRTTTKKEKNPVNADIRLFHTGALYPSAAIVNLFNLEYQDKDSETPGNGFDIADSQDFPVFQTPKRCILIIPTSRKLGRVDIFASVGFNKAEAEHPEVKEGTPMVSVMEQGATTYGKNDLIPMIKEIYGIDLADQGEGKPAFLDLSIYGSDDKRTAFTLPTGKTVTFIPKKVARGAKKDDLTIVRRENPQIYVLYPTPVAADVPVVSTSKDLAAALAPATEDSKVSA